MSMTEEKFNELYEKAMAAAAQSHSNPHSGSHGIPLDSNFDRFIKEYAAGLALALRDHPDQYSWPPDQIGVVLDRMIAALKRGSYNKDGYAFKTACKKLDIPYTYKAINAFIAS